MMKKDILANLYQKCLILCSMILLNVLHNMSATSLVAVATYWVSDLPNIKGISDHLWCSILICINDASHARFNKHINIVSSGLWPHLMFCELKITNILKSVSCHGNRIFVAVGVFPVKLLAYQVSMVYAAN